MIRMKKYVVIAAIVLAMGLVSVVRADVPRAEHPRPDAYRANWMNLNGDWQFEIDEKNDGLARGLTTGVDLNSKIVVPFCPESKLSGIEHTDFMKWVWYRRHFEVPASMKGKRVLLHFGAVDYQAWVWVNGEMVGSHRGSNVDFAFDVTDVLKDGQNEVVVRVFDDTRSGLQATGKQTHSVSEGCVYTRTTGIWQTVWLEAVGDVYVDKFKIVADPEKSRVMIQANVEGVSEGMTLTAVAKLDGKIVGKESCKADWRNNTLVVELSTLKLWEPGNGVLYDLDFVLTKGKKVVDQVSSYFGMRTVSLQGRGVLINGKHVFQRLILDQGFYPDGLWTAPSDAALKRDIELSMAAGYNGARLHQKVFEPRFLYWADKLGYMVWGEYTNWGYNYDPAGYNAYTDEWTEILLRDRNHPAIVGWCPFNETPQKAGEMQRTIYYLTQAVDPTRPIFETSGWSHTMADVEMRDIHDYTQDPAALKAKWMAFFDGSKIKSPSRYGDSASQLELGVPFYVSEFGGIGWSLQGGWGYGAGPKTLDEFYDRYAGLCGALLDNPNMFGFCYTQLTDIEQEQNGLYYYDRRPKFDMKKIYAATAREAAYERTGPTASVSKGEKVADWTVVVGASIDAECKPYKYTTENPGEGWTAVKFNDSGWKEGMPGFGRDLPNVKTRWDSPDIWMRGTFKCDGKKVKRAAIVVFYDEDTEVYVNDKRIWSRKGYNTGYSIFEVTNAFKEAVVDGVNSISSHTRQTGGGQFIDYAILVEYAD